MIKSDVSKFIHVKNYWPDEVRLHMIEKSEFYQTPNIYQYGFYDAYQLQNAKIDEAIVLIQKARSENGNDALLQDAIIKLLTP